MRFSRKSKGLQRTRAPSDFSLFIKINANRAADVVPGSSSESNSASATAQRAIETLSKKTVNPCLVAQINSSLKRTSRKLNTSQPSWNAELVLPLKQNDYSQVLSLTVWDKHKRYKNYLGELRLNLGDVFYTSEGKFQSMSELKWYKLYSSQKHHSFVTGSLLVSFELIVKKVKNRRHGMRRSKVDKEEPKPTNAVPGIVVVPPTQEFTLDTTIPSDNEVPTTSWNSKVRDLSEMIASQKGSSTSLNDLAATFEPNDLYSKVDSMDLSDTETEPVEANDATKKIIFDSWKKTLIYSSADPATKPDEQGFYNDTPEVSQIMDNSDIESIVTSKTNLDTDIDSDRPPESDSAPRTPNNWLGVSLEHADASSISDTSIASHSDGGLERTPKKPKKRSRLLRMKLPKSSVLDRKFEVSNRKVLGVLFIEIISCSDLPPVKNKLRTSFDMDPFVVVTFGRKTFRTSWKRHNLNPIFNERLAFEILSHEKNFNIQFNVLDKDQLSFHDKVAEVSLAVREFLNSVDPVKQSATSYMPLGDEPAESSNDSKKGESNENGTGSTGGESIQAKTESATSLKGDNGTGDTSVNSADPSVKSVEPSSKNHPSFRAPTPNYSDSQHSSIQILEDDNLVQSVRKKKFTNRKKITYEYADTSKFRTMNLSLNLEDKKLEGKYNPQLKVRVRFETYEDLRKKFWRHLLEQFNLNENENTEAYDYFELISLLDTIGCTNSDDLVNSFYENYGKSQWGGDLLSFDQIIESLEKYITGESTLSEGVEVPSGKFFEIEKCPMCLEKRLSKKQDIDIITHFAICTSKDWSIVNKLLVSSYVSPQAATKKWISKFLIKLTYGKYKLGSNSANILVQDRVTGIIMEEKMGIYIRLGIRLLYKGLDKAKSRRIRILLKRLSIKQGIKFDNPISKNDIESFVKFHQLDMRDFVEEDYNKYETFNEFFYRKLKPGVRLIEGEKRGPDGDYDKILTSPADCRCVAFSNVDNATEFWIKGKNFTIAKLFNGNFNNLESTDLFKPALCSLGIFRLAPQDYHRFHSPIEGKIGKIKFIDGEYYTVNPMAIRSELDVFGENIRAIVPIETKYFGTVIMIPVGAMMVGSTVLTVKEGDTVKKGDEIGYFKFGGSTIILLIEAKNIRFDSDLINNSISSVETLVRMGQSVGHTKDIPEFKRDMIDFDKQSKDFKMKLIRVLTGGDLSDKNELSWESSNIKITNEDLSQIANDVEADDLDDFDSYDEEDEEDEEEEDE